MSRDDCRAQAVDPVLQDHGTDVDDRSHKSHGISLPGQFQIELLSAGKILPARKEYPGSFHNVDSAQYRADSLRDDCRGRGAPYAHAGSRHQRNVQNDIQDRGNDQEDQGHGGIPDRAQKR